MIWVFFWGIVTGVGIMFFGALFGAVFYDVLRTGVIKHINEKEQENQ